jgi:hypothetical protein
MKAAIFLLIVSAPMAVAATYPDNLQQHWDPDHPNPIVDAVQVWRLGEAYFTAGQRMTKEEAKAFDDAMERAMKNAVVNPDGSISVPATEPITVPRRSEISPREFKQIDGPDTIPFLDGNSLKPVVQFSCARQSSAYEDALEVALENKDPEIRVQALAVLLRCKAAHSAAEQWKTLQDLKKVDKGPLWSTLLEEMETHFDARRLTEALKAPPPEEGFYSDSSLNGILERERQQNLYYWHVRATGARKLKEQLPRLAELSLSRGIYISLAAEKSLEDFEGNDGDQALARCLLGWRYNAYVHAADALLKRNKKLLENSLLQAAVPDDCRYIQGIYLAKCDNPEAVPILCETVGKVHIIDGSMFAEIARLATHAQQKVIVDLPSHVRPEQKARAEEIVKNYTARNSQ